MKSCNKKPGIHPRVQYISVFQVFSYVLAFDQGNQICELVETTVPYVFNKFLERLLIKFRNKSLRPPNDKDFRRTVIINESRGF